MEHILPPLPYPDNALEPYISRETLNYHHGKHHRAYVRKLNELIRGTEFENLSLEDILKSATDDIFNNAGQIWNHNFYWNCLSPIADNEPTGEFAQAIRSSFDSFAGFKNQFSKAAEGKFGSGWAWLIRDTDGTLKIVTTSNAGTPIKSGQTALLTCDVWEHAYYIDYHNARPDYVKSFWEVANWAFVENNWRESMRSPS